MTIEASAHPEKRLFISLLTRDISLIDAFLDLLDNSINAALRRSGFVGSNSEEYLNIINQNIEYKYEIRINFDKDKVFIEDNCGGISAEEAKKNVFVFGAVDGSHTDDRLSVYGIGLKRAMFKLGRQISMQSDHAIGGFELNLDVSKWESDHKQPWTFEIEERTKSASGGTNITVTKLYPEVVSRISDPAFATSLVNRVSKAYSFFLNRLVKVYVNSAVVEPDEPQIGSNQATDSETIEDVSVAIVAGLGIPKDGRYSTENAGWNVYCNGRSVISYDKSPLTGWGVDGYLPSFQPKHRPFVGLVFFTSDKPESLPWTTTKLGVNPDNIVWQKTLRRMADVGRQITRFLDSRYGEEGTSVTLEDLSSVVGETLKVSPLNTTSAATFNAPKRQAKTTTSIQYNVDKKKLAEVKASVGRSGMSNSDAGRYTFDYYYENEVDDA